MEGEPLKFDQFRYIACQNRHICATLQKALTACRGGELDSPSPADAEKAFSLFNTAYEILLLQGLPWLYSPEDWPEVKERILKEGAAKPGAPSPGGESSLLQAVLDALEEEKDPEAHVAWKRLWQKLTSS